MADEANRGDRVLVRSYVGGRLDEVVAAYWEEAENLARDGYEPVTTEYVRGEWNLVEILGSVILVPLLVGIPLVVRLLATKPTGTLLVTYSRRH